jgi:Eco29kI-like restriction endonuclease
MIKKEANQLSLVSGNKVMKIDPDKYLFSAPEAREIFEKARRAIRAVPPIPLAEVPRFPGVGVYALEYLGDSPLYELLASRVRKGDFVPIYVGKAIPAGSRKGKMEPIKNQLSNRIRQHAETIRSVDGLEVEDFQVRFLTLEKKAVMLIASIESELIGWTMAPWNSCIDGFGNHTPGKRRFNQSRSDWDVLHPGRPWAEKCTGPRPTQKEVRDNLKSYLGTKWQ